MNFYKSDIIEAKNNIKYSGLKIQAGGKGKILIVGKDLIAILWDKDKRQLARLCPPNDILKVSKIEKVSKGKPWNYKTKEKLDSKSIDISNSKDTEINNTKPAESNVMDYGQDPLAQDANPVGTSRTN